VTSPFRKLLVVASAVLLLGACSAGGSAPGDATRDATTAQRETTSGHPSVGDCWQEDDYATARTWDSWHGAARVDCQGSHNTITIAVVDLPADMQLATGTQTDDERRKLNSLCVPSNQVVVSANRQGRLDMFYYQPSPEQVASGQRWVRCDAALRALGPMSEHKFETLPATVDDLKAALTADPLRYQLCINTPAGDTAGPGASMRDASAVVVSCDGPSQWELAKTWEPDLDHAPTHDEAMAIVTPVCRALVGETNSARTRWYAGWPTADDWLWGQRTMQCWLARGGPATETDQVRQAASARADPGRAGS
jgi:hypothetical protein